MLRPVMGLALVLGLGLAACFSPPSGAVLFSCDQESAPACPPGYACQPDGCCHKDGSDVEANLGQCKGVESGTGAGTAGTEIPTTGSDTGSTSAGSDTSTSGGGPGPSTGDSGSDTGTSGA